MAHSSPSEPTPSEPTPSTTDGWARRALGTPVQAARSLLVVVVVTALLGGLTSPAQEYLPEALRSLANAAGPWLVVVMGSIVLARPRAALAVLLGILGFIVMNTAYGLVAGWRGDFYGGGLSSVWNRLAFVVGPIVGIAATWLRSSRPVCVALGVSAPAAVLIGEGSYGLTVVSATTSQVFWSIELGVGAALVAAGLLLRVRTPAAAAVLVSASGIGAGLFYLAYSAL